MVAVARVQLPHGVKVGFVGFTNESTPDARLPGQPRPVRRSRPIVPAVNAEAAKLAQDGDAIVALGHEGATGRDDHRPDRAR